MLQRIGHRSHKVLLSAVLTCTLALGLAAWLQPVASANDCDNNAIIHCGTGSTAEFIQKVKTNDSLNGFHDLKAVYAHYGLEPADYDRFVSSARPGTAYQDGRIVVDGVTVATDAKSIGRLASYQGSGYFTTYINGHAYYGNIDSRAFKASSIPVMVLFDAKGVMQFAVLTSCGNPVYGSPNKPSYSCNKLHSQAVAGQPGTYRFTTDASADTSAGAHIAKLVYDFGDNSRQVTVTNPNQAVVHTYARSDSYTAKVTVYVNLPGKQTVTVTSSNCQTVIKVSLPFYQCVQLAATALDNARYSYKFVTTTKAGNGARVQSVTFDYGDGHKDTIKQGTNGKFASAHKYTKDGNVMAVATATVLLPGGKTVDVSGPNCRHKVPVAIPYYSCATFNGSLLTDKPNHYKFTVTADYSKEVSFKKAVFDFGDKSQPRTVVPNGTAVTTDYTYASAAKYEVTATLYFTIGKQSATDKCSVLVTPTQQVVQECLPGIPQGSSLCNCQYNAQLPANSDQCVLPNTGAGSFVTLFGAAVVAGFFIFRQFIYKRLAPGGDVATTGPAPAAPSVPQVVAPKVHRNAQQPLHHARYHQPHRFRPGSHHEHHTED
ncbi:MAG TPA: hypothetical protein VFH39_05030 [Candidatus Saccharimonadales bacterium]|nr:hypothetical protein [Candidatus Saccharimonadales bacterium]